VTLLESRDILDTLKKEHDEVKELLENLSTADTPAQRRTLVRRIKAALVPHTKAEEKVVYDAVIALREKDAQMNGYEGYLEHEWAAKTLQRLEAIYNAASPVHKATGKVLKELVEHHIEEEERNVWADVKRRFSDEDRLETMWIGHISECVVCNRMKKKLETSLQHGWPRPRRATSRRSYP
jgi:hemerythrin-like domain-containing protein